MGFQISPGVDVIEKDASTVVPFASTTNAGFAGNFTWGPVEARVLVSSELDVVNRFGKPDSNTFVSFFTCADFLAYANNLRIVRAANTGARNAVSNSAAAVLIKNEGVYENSYLDGSGTFGSYAGRYAGSLGNSLKVSTCGSANAYSLNLSSVSITANAGAVGDTTIGTLVGANSYIVTGDYVKLGSNPYIKVTSANATGITLASALTTTVTVGSTILRKWEYADEFDSAPGTSPYVANLLGSRDELHVIVVDVTGLITGIPGTILEKYPFVSKASDAKSEDGSTLYYPTVIFNQSRWIYWGDHDVLGTNWGNTSAATTFTNVVKPVTETLAGGVTATLTNADLLRAWDQFVDPEAVDVSLLPTGDSNAVVSQYIIDNILTTRKDCVGFFSPPRTAAVNNTGSETDAVIAHRNSLSSTSYAVLDCGWKYRFDKYNDTYRYTPLNADIAGLCARTDLTRDPWYSPAGYIRGSIKNVVRLSWIPNKTQRDELYKNGINPVVAFPGEGNILYGDKTLQSKPSAFDRINVRRLFITLEKSIARFAKYSLFEFNDEFTRAAFVSAVEPYLRDVQGRRGITDFRVVCDDTNNTPQVINNNAFVGDIYVIPAYSINFITLNFTAVRTGVEFSEIVGKF
jgi:hypothetical protein